MILNHRFLTDPDRNVAFGVFALAVSYFAFAYSSIFGQKLVLLFYAVWLPLLALVPMRILGRDMGRVALVLPFALLAGLSVAWSAEPSVTLRAALQYLSCILCALIAARVLKPSTLFLGSLIGISVVVLYSFMFGSFSYDRLDGTYTFVGEFASKNQLGLFASLGVIFAVAAFMEIKPGWRIGSLLLAAAAFNLYALVASRSATSMIALVAGMLAIAVFRLVARLSKGLRVLLFWSACLAAVIGSIVFWQGGGAEWVLSLFGKDATLTGRTYLWSEGMRFGAESPLVGAGYQAWWVRGFSEAERLWTEFYITARDGFHFHNTFIQAYVDLGLAGFGLIALTFAGILAASVRRFILSASSQSISVLALLIVLAVRSFVEVDMIYPYTVGAFLFYVIGTTPRHLPVTRSAVQGVPIVLPGLFAGRKWSAAQ